MDSFKKEIQKLSKEVLEIKKTEKEDKINIRILSNELGSLKLKITEAEEKRDHIPEIIKNFNFWDKKIKKEKKKKRIKNIVLGSICVTVSILLALSPYVVVLGIPVAVLAVSLGLDISQMEKLKICRQTSIVKLGKVEKKDMDIGTIKTLANKKKKELNEELNNLNQKYHNKELELNQAQEKRKRKEDTYCNLSDKIKKLTEERTNLSNMLLEEYENSSGEKCMSKSLFTSKKPQ